MGEAVGEALLASPRQSAVGAAGEPALLRKAVKVAPVVVLLRLLKGCQSFRHVCVSDAVA